MSQIKLKNDSYNSLNNVKNSNHKISNNTNIHCVKTRLPPNPNNSNTSKTIIPNSYNFNCSNIQSSLLKNSTHKKRISHVPYELKSYEIKELDFLKQHEDKLVEQLKITKRLRQELQNAACFGTGSTINSTNSKIFMNSNDNNENASSTQNYQ